MPFLPVSGSDFQHYTGEMPWQSRRLPELCLATSPRVLHGEGRWIWGWLSVPMSWGEAVSAGAERPSSNHGENALVCTWVGLFSSAAVMQR